MTKKESKPKQKRSYERYKTRICRLLKEDDDYLTSILENNDIGFTEFIRIAIYHLVDKKIVKSYKIK